jgi:hypothetical protein
MNALLSTKRWSTTWIALAAALAAGGNAGALAHGPDVRFDFARLTEYHDVTPLDRLERYPHERLIAVSVPISVRFEGLAGGEVEHLDIEVDGSPAGLRVEDFAPTTELASDAVAVETITKTIKERSLGAKLGGAIPVPIGPIAAEVGPSVSAGISRANEATEKVKRLPPKRPVVVSGTFAQGQGVFFKFKQSSQTSFEGVHELEITFAVPADWQAGGVRISCTARGHRHMLWMAQPTVFGEVTGVVELYPAGDAALREAAMRRLQAAADDDGGGWGLGDLFLTGG